jgi:hypothetical protein
MYSRLNSLYFSSPEELKDPERIERVCRDRRHMPLIAPFGFFVGGLIALCFSGLLIFGVAIHRPLEGGIGAACCLLLALSLFWGGKKFWQARQLDPLRGYLFRPSDYGFIAGEITGSSYAPGERRSLGRIIAQGQAVLPDGQKLLFFEFFKPSAWPYVDKDADAGLKPGDDWYDQKGRRPYLPVAVSVIYAKNRPRLCALAGILQNP